MAESKPPMKLQIDGIDVEAKPGETILQAAAKLGKHIPHFCYHEGLSIVGQCRMCYVEIEGQKKLATSCSTTCAEGMKVKTDSDFVKKGQSATLEFVLLHHPLDCPICDRGGECKLQDYTYDHGPPRSRMVDEKDALDKHKAVSDQVILDQERCILCTRCVRFSSELDGRAELVVNERASHSHIDVFEGRPMQSPFSGNVVDLCPVGALTARDFRFKARPWELRKHQGLCTGCSMGCNIEIDTKHRHPGIARPDGKAPVPRIERLMPRENRQVNDWWMCDRGRWGYHFHNDEVKRLHQPLARRTSGGTQEAVSLKEIGLILDQAQGSWEFWISDNAPHEQIAWAKELRASWQQRGRQVAAFNPSPFGDAFLKYWASRSASPWFAGQADWSGITKVVSPLADYRQLESRLALLSLRLGPKVRAGKVAWEERSLDKLSSKDDLATTVYIVPVPKTEDDLTALAKLPPEAKVCILWTHANSRGLLNEGIAPLEVSSFKGRKPSGSVFYFGQTSQNAMNTAFAEYLKASSLLVAADSFENEATLAARVVLPLEAMFESQITLTNVDNIRQTVAGIQIHHPSIKAIERGAALVSPALRLI